MQLSLLACSPCLPFALPPCPLTPVRVTRPSSAGPGVPARPPRSPRPAPRRSRSSGEGSRPSCSLIGWAGGPAARRLVPGIVSRGPGQISGLSRTAPALRLSHRPAETAGRGCRLSRSAAAALPNELHQVGSRQALRPRTRGARRCGRVGCVFLQSFMQMETQGGQVDWLLS